MNGLHSQFRIFQNLDIGDTFLAKPGCGAADGAQIEAAVYLSGFCYVFRPVAFGQHHHGTTEFLKYGNIGVHTGRSGRPERS